MIVLAHAGHWLVQLLYLVPVLFIVAVILREKHKERRERRTEQTAHPDHSGRD